MTGYSRWSLAGTVRPYRHSGPFADSCHRGVIPGRGEYLRWSAA